MTAAKGVSGSGESMVAITASTVCVLYVAARRYGCGGMDVARVDGREGGANVEASCQKVQLRVATGAELRLEGR